MEDALKSTSYLAFIDGNRFIANRVPLVDGENTIVAVVSDVDGNTDSLSRTVYADVNDEYIRITSNPITGINPLAATLSIGGSFAISASDLQFTGPGEVILNADGAGNYEVMIPKKGIYFFTAQVIHQNQTYSDTVAVEVLDKMELNAFLKSKWDGMKSELIAGDIEGALNSFAYNSKNRYRNIFNALNEHLHQITADMQEIQLIYAKNNCAKYRTIRQQLIEGMNRNITYYIYFIKDQMGIWRIEKF